MLDSIENAIFRGGFSFLMKVKPPLKPKFFEGSGSSKDLYKHIRESCSRKLLIVTTGDLIKLNLLESTYNTLDQLGIEYVVFDKVQPNPSLSSVREAIGVYNENDCDAVLAFGGGSVIDAAKAVALQIGNDVPVEKLVGLFSARKKAVPFYTVPTTAGTGSEVTSAAVLTNDENHQKVFIVDHKTISLATALDPDTMLGLPAFITADTGMDVLTHAIEGYVSRVSTPEAMDLAVNAVKLVFENLPEAYSNGKNSEARKNMALASYQAGVAFNRMGLGFVHAISHQLTAFYNTAHGRANAIVLPYVLQTSFEHIIPQLAELSRRAGLSDGKRTDRDIARDFVDRVIQLAQSLNIPTGLDDVQEKDYAAIVKNARREAIRNYPVPYLLSVNEVKDILRKLKANNEDKQKLR